MHSGRVFEWLTVGSIGPLCTSLSFSLLQCRKHPAVELASVMWRA